MFNNCHNVDYCCDATQLQQIAKSCNKQVNCTKPHH